MVSSPHTTAALSGHCAPMAVRIYIGPGSHFLHVHPRVERLTFDHNRAHARLRAGLVPLAYLPECRLARHDRAVVAGFAAYPAFPRNHHEELRRRRLVIAHEPIGAEV